MTIGNHSGGNTTVALSSADVSPAPLTSQGYDFHPTAGVPFTGIVASFSDADPRALPTTDFTASIDWGDGTVSVGSVVVNEDGGYLVKGTHAYRVGSYAIKTTIISSGGASTIATGTASVPDSPISLTLNSGFSPPEGTPYGGVIASFSTPDSLSQATDYKALVSFGDGNQTAGQIISTGTAGQFQVLASNTYLKQGQYPVNVVITSSGGSQVQASGTITVNPAPITVVPVAVSGMSKTQLTGLVVARFTTTNPGALASAYSSTITWGDNTSSAGTIAVDPDGGFDVTGSHYYSEGGTYPIGVTVVNGSATSTVASSAVIDNKIFPLSGSGASGTISPTGLTASSNPVFTGTAEPGSMVTIYAQAAGGATPVAVGTGQANASGVYTVTSSTLGDGQYTVYGSATDPTGRPSSGLTVLYPTAERGPLTVDTQGPKVVSAQLDAKHATITLVLSDGLSGLLASGLLNSANFSLATTAGQTFPVAGLTVSPVSPTTQQTLTLSFGAGAKGLTKGKYVFTINASGVTDAAGNPLDERYFVAFPGLYNKSGQNFVAAFTVVGTSASTPQQYVPPAEVVAAAGHRLFVRKHFHRKRK